MKMRKVYGYDGSFFYAGVKDNKILIRSNEVSNPFEYMYQLGKTIDKLSQKVQGDKVEVVFDLTPFLERKEIFSFIYDKKTKLIDLNSYRKLSELP